MQKSSPLSIFVFLGFIGSFFLLSFFLPDIDFSENENRYLKDFPVFSMNTLLDGTFSQELDIYTSDQFPFREVFVSIKSNTELLIGKQENNGVYYTNQETLIDQFKVNELQTLHTNLQAIQDFSTQISIPTYLCIIPSQNDIYSYKLPKYAPYTSEKELLLDIQHQLINSNISTISLYEALWNHREEYVYYNTDHHWTSLGAFYSSEAILHSLGKDISTTSSLQPTIVSSDFYGSNYSKSGFRNIKPDVINIYTPNVPIKIYNGSSFELDFLYQEAYLETKDQYNYFLGGNHPYVTIDGTGSESLLLIKDSFANSMIPFFIDSYAQIHVVDLRFTKDSMSDYIEEHSIDTVLITYSISNIVQDKNLPFLN